MSKETVKHWSAAGYYDEEVPVCGDVGDSVLLVSETTCERCLKTLAKMGKDAIARAFELDYFDVPKEPPSAHDSDV